MPSSRGGRSPGKGSLVEVYLDDDGNVDFRDYGMLTRLWRRKDSDFWSAGTDLTGDGIAGFADLRDLVAHWLAGCDWPIPP